MKKIFINLCFLALLLSLSSCNKWLDLKPRDGIIKDEFWKTKEDVQAAVSGMYSSMLASPPGVGGRALTEYMFMWGEIRADMVDQGPGYLTEEKDIMDVNIVESNSIVKWDAFYRTINYCNTILDFAPGAKALDPTFSTKELNAYMAEALTIRSMMYFYLVRSFKDVPLKLTSTSKDTEIKNIGKARDSVVLAQIVTDLNTAEKWAVDDYGSNALNKGRITKFAVNALQADVYLWMEKYDDCINRCVKIIESERYTFLNPTAAWYTNVFYNGSSNETIFELNYKSANISNPFYDMLRGPKRRFITTGYVASEVFAPDEDDPARTFDVRSDFFGSSDLIIYKHAQEYPAFLNWQMYRLSDIYLMLAEAENYSGSPSLALTFVEDVREARNAVDATAATIGPVDADANSVGEYILAERSREFAFEGKRWYDILRFAKRDNYSSQYEGILRGMVLRAVAPSFQQAALNKYKDVNSHYFPIHQDELFADPTLTQNPFYSK